jgi:Asp-tRNA(Asn)/Glu-tRNA(Gln) amidotransferase A subunit family amidase
MAAKRDLRMSQPEPTATELVRDIAAGKVTALEVTEACLRRVELEEPRIRAWVHLDPAHARAQTEPLDARKRAGKPLGRLHGLPIGVKDIYDTVDYPTENGSVLDEGRRPREDAWVVRRLRAEGAVILGKTVTTEYACFAPGPTRNPHDPERTPGGSSSGSAAAVAAGVVPVALGSQTNGSVIRPASFCGVYGLKPSFGLIPRTGVLTTSRTLDHVGFFARSLEDLALLGEVLAGDDPADPATRPTATPPLGQVLEGRPPVAPRLAFVPGPTWNEAEPATVEAFEELGLAMGEHLHRIDLPQPFDQAIAVHRAIWTSELAFHLADRWERGQDRLSPQLRALIEAGHATSAFAYQTALDRRAMYARALEELLAEYDAIVTPAAPGEAPQGLEATGSPVFCSLWTLTGLPALSLPILKGPNGLPLGCQLIAGHGDEARLLRLGRWLERQIGGNDEREG